MTNTNSKNASLSMSICIPDCVTKVRMGNTILTVSGYFKQNTTDTAVGKMIKVLKARQRINRSFYICDNPQHI